jgi:CheY-like chemotaxis protein
VLIVEDDRDIREGLAEALSSEGLTLTAVRDGVEALGALSAIARPCLVLLDLWMPMLDGERFLDFLERMPDRDDFFVVVVSAASYAAALKSRPGVAAVLRKPFSVEELLAVVRGFSA